jgi:hypothetical protein
VSTPHASRQGSRRPGERERCSWLLRFPRYRLQANLDQPADGHGLKRDTIGEPIPVYCLRQFDRDVDLPFDGRSGGASHGRRHISDAHTQLAEPEEEAEWQKGRAAAMGDGDNPDPENYLLWLAPVVDSTDT